MQRSTPEELVPPETLRLQLNAYDIAELRDILIDPTPLKVVHDSPPSSHGEPVTIAVLTVTPLVIQAIALWALKQRRKERVRLVAEKVSVDGSRESLAIELDVSESTSTATVVEQVVRGWQLNPSLIEAASSLGG